MHRGMMVRLPPLLVADLDRHAVLLGVSRADLVRRILAQWCENQE